MLTEAVLAALIQRCAPDVGYSTQRAVVQVESGGHPWVINSNTAKRSFKYNTQHEAAAAAEHMVRAGHNIDMGLGQINSANLKHIGLSPSQVFEPCTNIQASARLLKEKFAAAWEKHYQKGAAAVLRHALSRYNTGDDWRGIRNGYVRKVELAAARLAGVRPSTVNMGPIPASAPVAVAQVQAPSAVVWSRAPTHSPDSSGHTLSLTGTFVPR